MDKLLHHAVPKPQLLGQVSYWSAPAQRLQGFIQLPLLGSAFEESVTLDEGWPLQGQHEHPFRQAGRAGIGWLHLESHCVYAQQPANDIPQRSLEGSRRRRNGCSPCSSLEPDQ
jgi:hypothetical protein